MTRKKASYNPGLNPIKGHKFCPGTQTRSRDKLSSLPLGITKTSPLGPVLVRAPIGYLKLVLRYKFVILDTYHPDTVFT